MITKTMVKIKVAYSALAVFVGANTLVRLSMASIILEQALHTPKMCLAGITIVSTSRASPPRLLLSSQSDQIYRDDVKSLTAECADVCPTMQTLRDLW